MPEVPSQVTKYDTDNRSVVMVFRATPAEREAVEQRAIREQVGISELLRRAIDAYLVDEEPGPWERGEHTP